MSALQPAAVAASEHALELELVRRAREAGDPTALEFIAVNDTHVLSPYRQSALWFEGDGVVALSGVVDIERNAPYVQWLRRVCRRLADKPADRIERSDLDPREAEAWGDWLPQYAVWLPVAAAGAQAGMPRGGLLLARDTPWSEQEITRAADWLATWRCAYHAAALPVRWRSWGARWRRLTASLRRLRLLWLLAAAALLSIPVPLTVLAPGELVPAEPVAVRAPLDGVLRVFFVRPNQLVKKGDPLFAFDDVALDSRYDMALQSLRTAEAELRQYEQQSLSDMKARAQLPAARGAVGERRAELDYLKTQRARSQVVASQDGYVLFEEPSEWIGRPVTTGERVMRIANPEDKEIEAWVAAGDAIPLPRGAAARLYLSADPLDPVAARVRFVAYDAARRPDGVYAYRVRAALDSRTVHRIGLKGTVRLVGEEVPLAYWIVRRPLATIRELLGV